MIYDIIKGSIFQLGEHRIICGIPRSEKYVSTVMKDEYASMVSINLNDTNMEVIPDHELYLTRVLYNGESFLIDGGLTYVNHTDGIRNYLHKLIDVNEDMNIKGMNYKYLPEEYDVTLRQSITDYTKPKSIVLDLVGGTSSIIGLCEELNRKAYIIRESRYDVLKIIHEWESITGNKAVVLDCEEEWNKYCYILKPEYTETHYTLMRHYRVFRTPTVHKTVEQDNREFLKTLESIENS